MEAAQIAIGESIAMAYRRRDGDRRDDSYRRADGYSTGSTTQCSDNA